jgi:hypothetical protein
MKKRLALCMALAGCILWVTSCGQQKISDTGSEREIKEITLTLNTPEPTPEATAKAKKAYPKITSKAKVEDFGGTVKIGDSAYELYNYVESYADKYAAVVNDVATALEGKAQVYDMVAPTSVGITLPDNKRSKINSSNQKESIKSIYNKLDSAVTTVNLYNILMRHRDEYIFFRTDHHWTSRGAYYAYRAFCRKKGLTGNRLSRYQRSNFGIYLGSFYNDTNGSSSLRADRVKAYYPLSNPWITMTYRNESGETKKTSVISDDIGYNTSMKYVAFISGDNPYSVIRNDSIRDGSSCIVVKESYGNAFVPYLADHYQTIYVVDYRYWSGSVTKLAKKKKVQDVIFLNNISMTRNAYLIGKMAQVK